MKRKGQQANWTGHHSKEPNTVLLRSIIELVWTSLWEKKVEPIYTLDSISTGQRWPLGINIPLHMPECQVNSHRHFTSLCWRSLGAKNDRQAHCVEPKEVFSGYTRAKLVKAGAEIIEAARTGAQVGLRGIWRAAHSPIFFGGIKV